MKFQVAPQSQTILKDEALSVATDGWILVRICSNLTFGKSDSPSGWLCVCVSVAACLVA